VGYDFSGSNDFTDGLSLRFYVDNVFDEDPPEYRSNENGQAKFSGFTLGRMYKVGLTKTFF
jgi:iron complex outermembrane receptor protein